MASHSSGTDLEHIHSPHAICTTSSLQKRCGKYWIWQPDLQEPSIFLLSTNDLNSFCALTTTEGLPWMLSPPNTILLFELGFTLYLPAALEDSSVSWLNYSALSSTLSFLKSPLGLTRKILFKITSLFQVHLAHFIASVLKFLRMCGNSPISVL